MTDQNIVRVEQDGDIAVIVVNNPPVNTITAAVRSGLDAALLQLATLPGIRAVLLRCEGSTFERDGEAAPVEAGDRLAELLATAVARIGVRRWVGDGALGRFDDRREGRHVRDSDPERDDVDPGGALVGDLAFELREQVRRNALEALTESHVAPC